MRPSFVAKFIEESIEIFQNLENDLVALESDVHNAELVNTIFRGLHTLKGSGAMVGFHHLSEFTHELETLVDCIRNGKCTVTPEIISLILEACDFCKQLRDDPDDVKFDPLLEKHLLDAIHAYLPESTPLVDVKHETALPKQQSTRQKSIFRIRFVPGRDLFIKGINPIVLLQNCAALGTFFCYQHEDEIPLLENLDPERCYLGWTCILITGEGIDAVRDLFVFAEDAGELTITELTANAGELGEATIPLIGEILLEKGDISQEALTTIVNSRKLFGEQVVAMGVATPDTVASALFEQNALRTVKKEINGHFTATTIRVQNEKLDVLTNAVSELVTLQARLTQYSGARKEAELTAIAEYLEKLTSLLRDTVMVIRMVPVEEGFSTMHRLLRDLSKELGKEVSLTIDGGDTEIDKAVMDNLKDPMMHLVRNSIDHGLEPPEERIAAGKSPAGQVVIRAEHMGSHVFISVIDDGKGLDADKILAKAGEKGLVTASDNLSEKEIHQFIFLPGFSTAEKTTAISGRGVGMDVVKRNIEAIRGEVSIESVKGKGTTIRMKLPITLAIIDGLLFTVGNELFVVNIATVSECMELTSEIRAAAGAQNILRLRESIIPFVHLRDLLNIPGTAPEHEQIIVVHTHEHTIGFVVDSVQGKHQTVVKTTGRLFATIKEVTGATILGDGRIALILDANILAQRVNMRQTVQEMAEV